MNIQEQYQKVITSLRQGSRALMQYSSEERGELAQQFNQELSSENTERLEQILCLVDHCATDDSRFEPMILTTLNTALPPRLLIFTLNCARKHIIQARYKRGQRLDFDFLDALQKLLFSGSPEVVEWTLRSIDECGNQGVFFLQYFDKIKPPPWKWFNSHNRAVREIITMLERRWSRFEKQT